MTESEKAIDRTMFLGGSDAAGVLNMSRWDTPLRVWAEKTGQIPSDSVDSEESEWGRDLEPNVVRWFERKTGKRVLRERRLFTHPQYGFLAGQVDGLIEGEEAGFEAKTCSAWKVKEWDEDQIPQEYIIQCYHYLMVTGLKRWYIAVLIGGQRARWKVIERDEHFIAAMLAREVEFWNTFVIPTIMPTTATSKDTQVLSELFPIAAEGSVIQLDDEANVLVEQLTAAKQDSKSVENLIETLENQLKIKLGAAEAGETSRYKIFWSNVRSRRLDTKALEAAHPEIAMKFKPEKITRRFSYKQKLGE